MCAILFVAGEHFAPSESPHPKEADMKRFIGFVLVLAALLAACGPIIPESGSGAATPVVLTAVVSTAVVSTIGPLPTQGPAPTVVPATPIPTLASAALSTS